MHINQATLSNVAPLPAWHCPFSVENLVHLGLQKLEKKLEVKLDTRS
jgi:hypothetical protein